MSMADGMTKPVGAVRRRPHSWTTLGKKSRIPWPICRHCGLLRLRNKRTERAVRLGCWLWEDEQ